MSSRLTPEPAGFGPFAHRRASARFATEGLTPNAWSNGPGRTYPWHDHPFRDIIRCVKGSIVFHTRTGNFELVPGSRFEMEPHTEHAATVGSRGVACLEAHVIEAEESGA
jgi:quercetin dioxygenase-like cupin family protein